MYPFLIFQTAAPVSRYSYVPRAPRSTIWDYNFSTSKVAGGDCQPQSENKPTNFSFVPRTENKPEPSTAEKVRLGSGSGESRQSRPRTRSTAVTNITEEEKKQRNPLKLPSWQLNRPTVSLSYFISERERERARQGHFNSGTRSPLKGRQAVCLCFTGI